jgi:DNA-binding MarR family transcriptional regulator
MAAADPPPVAIPTALREPLPALAPPPASPPRPAAPTPLASGPSEPPKPSPEASAASRPADPKYGNLRTSYRILLHVARQGRTAPGDIPPIGLTQRGMIDALGVNQGTLAGPLQRLVLSGALTVERSHARGADRRVKVYRLTPLGEHLVEELRRSSRDRGTREGTERSSGRSGP